MMHDSTADTLHHARRVQQLLNDVVITLLRRGEAHDASKLQDPEKVAFDTAGHSLKSLVFGSPAYKEALEQIRPALEHHYAHNSHHPEHYANGIAGMSLFDLVEMVMDWLASSERGPEPVIKLTHLADRFRIEPQLLSVITNTVEDLGWHWI
jgi:hypothetical protein